MTFSLFQVQNMLSSDNSTEKVDSKFPSNSHVCSLVIKIRNWSKCNLSALLFNKEVYAPISLHISDQSHSGEPNFEESKIINYVTRLYFLRNGYCSNSPRPRCVHFTPRIWNPNFFLHFRQSWKRPLDKIVALIVII